MSCQTPPFRLSVRTDERNPNHHLWNNNGTWWCHATLHVGVWQKRRIRFSLRTKDVYEAQRRRDERLRKLESLTREGA